MTTKTKIALVTGGSRGLGKNMVQSLAAKGLDVIFTYHSKKDEAATLVAEIEGLGRKAIALQLDVADSASFDGFVNEVKTALESKFQTDKFDYLVNNAGVGVHAAIADTTEEQFDNMVNIHFKAPFFLSQKLLAHQADGGGIVNISSGLSRFSFEGYAAYAASKGAIDTLTRYMAKELGARKIRVNVLAPGAIETDFGGGFVRDNPDMNNMISSITALGRAGLPDDIGGVIAFLCSDDAKWINGQRLEVSGGTFL